MAKVAKIAQKTRIQGVPYLGFNFNQNDSLYFSVILPKCAPNRFCGCLINVFITMACTTCSKEGNEHKGSMFIVQYISCRIHLIIQHCFIPFTMLSYIQ